jgi:hypothetical protein
MPAPSDDRMAKLKAAINESRDGDLAALLDCHVTASELIAVVCGRESFRRPIHVFDGGSALRRNVQSHTSVAVRRANAASAFVGAMSHGRHAYESDRTDPSARRPGARYDPRFPLQQWHSWKPAQVSSAPSCSNESGPPGTNERNQALQHTPWGRQSATWPPSASLSAKR